MSRNENGRGRCVNTTVPGLTPLLKQEGAAVMVAKERPAEGITPTPITDAEFIKATLDYHWTRFVGEAHPEMSHHEAACNFDDVVEAYRRENGMPPGTPPRIVSPYPRPNPMPPEYAELEARSRVQWPGRMSRPTGGRP